MTVDFERTGVVPTERLGCFDFGAACRSLGSQLESAAQRTGGLLLTMAILHALTLTVLPAIALVSNVTRLGRRLPRWLVIVFLVVVVLGAIQVIPAMIGLIVGAAGSDRGEGRHGSRTIPLIAVGCCHPCGPCVRPSGWGKRTG